MFCWCEWGFSLLTNGEKMAFGRQRRINSPWSFISNVRSPAKDSEKHAILSPKGSSNCIDKIIFIGDRYLVFIWEKQSPGQTHAHYFYHGQAYFLSELDRGAGDALTERKTNNDSNKNNEKINK